MNNEQQNFIEMLQNKMIESCGIPKELFENIPTLNAINTLNAMKHFCLEASECTKMLDCKNSDIHLILNCKNSDIHLIKDKSGTFKQDHIILKPSRGNKAACIIFDELLDTSTCRDKQKKE